MSFGNEPYWDEERVLLYGMRLGLTREETRRMVGDLPPEQARAALEQRFLPGYQQAQEAFRRGTPEERKGGFVSPATWRYMPEHLRQRRVGARPISSFEQTEFGQPIMEPGWIRRGQEAHAFPTTALTEGTYLARTAKGENIATWGAEKWEKRIQMLGAHEFVQMTGLESRRAYMPAGPGAERGEPGQIVRAAAIIGGDIGGPGGGFVDPSIGQARQTTYRQIPAPGPGAEYPWVSIPGATWGPGEQMVLGGGLTGEPTKKWSYTVRDVAALPGGGYGFALERIATTSAARLRLKAFGQKVEPSVASLRGMTTPTGEPLGIQAAYGLKDIQGYVYQHFMAQDPAYLAQSLGVKQSALASSYSEMGTSAMQAFAAPGGPMEQLMQTVHSSEILTAGAAARFRESGAMVREQPLPGGRIYGTVARQALVGDVLMQMGHDYPVGRPFLGREELEHIQRAPGQQQLYQQIMKHSAEARQGYVDLANAALASTGRYQQPYGTMRAEELNLPGMFTAASAQAREKLGYGPETAAPAAMVRRMFMERLAQSEAGMRHIAMQTPAGEMVMPPAKVMQRFGASGQWAGEEVSKYLVSAEKLLGAAASGGVPDKGTAEKFRAAQETLVRSSEFGRRVTGAFLSRAKGDVIRTSQALEPWEAYVPGMGGRAIQPFAFPSQGGKMWGLGMQMVGLTKEEALERGLNPEEMYFSMQINQALGGDVDGDLGYAMDVGALKRGPNGEVLHAVSGRRLDTPVDILAAAKETREEGAADLYQEMAGMQGPGTALTRDEALAQARKKIAAGRSYSAEEIETQIGAGASLRGRIGQYYNTFRGAMGTVGEAGRGALEKLSRISHGRAQRPAEQLPAMQVFHRLSKAGLIGKGGGLSTMAFDPSTGTAQPMAGGVYEKGEIRGGSGLKGLTALQSGALQSLVDVRGEKGELLLGSQQFGQLMGKSPGEASTLAKLQSAYQDMPRRRADILQSMMGVMGRAAQWGLQSVIGRTLAPAAVSRAMEKGASFQQLRLTQEQGQRFLELRRAQEARNLALGRRRSADVSEFEAKVEAIRQTAPEVGFVKPLATAAPTQAAAVSTVTEGVSAAAAAPTPEPVAPLVEAARVAEVTQAIDPSAGAPVPAAAGGGGRRAGPPEPPAPPPWPGEGAPAPPGPVGGGGPPARTPQEAQAAAGAVGMGPGLGQGTRMVVGAGGQLFVQQREQTGYHVKELQQINQILKQWGSKLKPLVESTAELNSKQVSALRTLDRMRQRTQAIMGMDPPQDVEAGQAVQEQLGQITPQMGWMGGIQGRLQAQLFGQAVGGGGGGGIGGWGRGQMGGMIGQRGLGGAARWLTTGFGSMMMRRMWQMTGGQAQAWMGEAGQADLATYQAAMAAGAPIEAPGGLPGQMISRGIRAQAGRVALGRQAGAAWTLPQAGMWERGPLGAAVGIGMPALGIGAMTGAIAGGPWGAVAGLGVAGIGAANYLYQSAEDPIGVGVGRAALTTGMQGGGFQGAPFQDIAGAAIQTMRAKIQGIFGYDAPMRQLMQQGQQGQIALEGQTAGLGAAGYQKAMMLRSQRLMEQFPGMMQEAEWSGMQGQMMRFGGYTNLADIPEQALGQSAALSRGMGMAPGALQQQMGAVGQAWGMMPGTEQMRTWQTSMLQAPSVTDYQRQMGIYQQYQPLARWGVSMEQVGGAPGLTQPQQHRLQQLAGGNRMLWSDIGRQIGDATMETLERGGLPMFTTGVGQRDPAQMGLQMAASAGGMWGVQDAMTGVQRMYRDRGLARRGAQLGWQAQMQWGGEGFSAMAPAPGSAYGLQDQLTQLGYQSQMQGFGYQQQMLDISNRQWQESQGLRREIFESRVGWQQEDIGRARGRAETRFGWRMEDWAYSENRSQLGFGWQMEDFDESIRMSSGRDRQRLQRQRERAVIIESMRREHHESQRDRMEQQKEWQDEDFDRQRDRNEQLIELQRRQFDMAAQHHQETYQMQRQNIARIRANYEERHRLQQALTKLQRQNAMRQHEWQQQALKDQLAMNRQIDALQADYKILTRAQATLVADWQRMVLYGEQFAEYFEEMFKSIMGSEPPATPSNRQEPPQPDDDGHRDYGAVRNGRSRRARNVSISVSTQQAQEVADAIMLTLDEHDRSYG